MQARNYTNPEDRGRFGFSMSGEYRTPYKGESVITALLVGLAAVAGAILFFVVRQIVQDDKEVQDKGSFFVAAAGGIALVIFIFILVMIFGVGIRNVKKGFKCQYSANDETFTTTIGGDLHVIKYADVTSMTFEPRTAFGKIRGYDITVKVKGVNEHYAVCSDGYMSPQATPFYIIQERMDILNEPHSAAYTNESRANSRAITRIEAERAQTGSLNAMDKMALLLGETSNMPELSSDSSPSQQAAARVTQMMNSYGQAEMPAVGQPMPLSASVYLGEDGRERPVTETQSQGTFYVKASLGVMIVLTLIMMSLSALVAIFLLTVIFSFVQSGNIDLGNIDTIITLVAAVLIQPFVIYKTVMQTHGKSYNYKADGRGFFVTSGRKDNDNTQLLYKDVMSVDYTPLKVFGKMRGYKVDILMNYGIVHYDYIFPSYRHPVPRQYLPFEVIRSSIPKNVNTKN